MSLFLSTTVNKMDKKGRVSVPANFRASLTQGAVTLFKSPLHACLEGFDVSFMDEISDRLDHFDLFSDAQDDLAMSIFGECVSVSLDETGRVVLPSSLCAFAQLTDKISFVGMGQKFQIWRPEALQERQEKARSHVRSEKLTIPKRPVVGGVHE